MLPFFSTFLTATTTVGWNQKTQYKCVEGVKGRLNKWKSVFYFFFPAPALSCGWLEDNCHSSLTLGQENRCVTKGNWRCCISIRDLLSVSYQTLSFISSEVWEPTSFIFVFTAQLRLRKFWRERRRRDVKEQHLQLSLGPAEQGSRTLPSPDDLGMKEDLRVE